VRFGRLTAMAAVGAVLALPQAASAAEYEVVAAQGDVFRPANLTVNQGDSVVFRNADPTVSPHNVKFDDGSFEQPSESQPGPWRTAPKQFPNQGTFRYYCEAHGGPGGVGMAGAITVTGPGGAPPPGPSLTPAPPIVESLRAREGRRNTIVVRVDPSFESTATVTIARKVGRGYRRANRVRKKVRRPTRITIRRDSRGRRLRNGRYRVSAQLKTSSGQTGPVKNTSVVLR
jgi:plastocyanin